jgi:hypothetical protein
VAKKVGVDHKTIPTWKAEEHFIDYQECYLVGPEKLLSD